MHLMRTAFVLINVCVKLKNASDMFRGKYYSFSSRYVQSETALQCAGSAAAWAARASLAQ